MVGPQSLRQALRGGRELESKRQLLARRARREVGGRAGCVMQLQHAWGGVREVKDPSDTSMINGETTTRLDEPREFPRAAGVRDSRADPVLLDHHRHIGFARTVPPATRQAPSIL